MVVLIIKKNRNMRLFFLGFMITITIVSQVNAQRFVKVFREDLVNNFKNDITFWKDYSSEYLSNYKYPIMQFKRIKNKSWNFEMINNDRFKNQTYRNDTIPQYNIEGDIVKYVVYAVEKARLNFLAFSDDPKLKDKIGMGYTLTNDDNSSSDFIYFVDYNCWDSLKEQGRLRFIQLMASSAGVLKSDSIIGITSNKEKSRIHIFEVGSYISDSSSNLPIHIEDLFNQFERDFINIYYSGNDSTYKEENDRWGNRYMSPYSINKSEEWYDAYGNRCLPQNIRNTFKLCAIDLYFEQLNKEKRTVYPGIHKEFGFHSPEGYIYYFLHHEAINKFSQMSQILFLYLIDIYK
jgi:hypothetical protein